MSKKHGKVCVCGHFGFGKELLNGQTVKTKIVAAELERRLGAAAVTRKDTHGGIKALLTLPFSLFSALRKNDNVVILPAHNGLRVIAPLLAFENRFFHRRLHYAVIGGWLPAFLEERPRLTGALKCFDGIYVETHGMKRALEAMGFTNVAVMPNCKALTILAQEVPVSPVEEPYKLCTFSRVMKEKGIEDAVEAVKAVNTRHGRTVFSLDIYGPIDAAQGAWFAQLQQQFPPYVAYKGVIPFDQSTQALKDYTALLFPTRFFTEGVPGTIIDAYAAGVPVIAARWESYEDVADEEATIGYPFGDAQALCTALETLACDPEGILRRKKACLRAARRFMPETVLDTLVRRL